jgi:hypothetical protein
MPTSYSSLAVEHPHSLTGSTTQLLANELPVFLSENHDGTSRLGGLSQIVHEPARSGSRPVCRGRAGISRSCPGPPAIRGPEAARRSRWRACIRVGRSNSGCDETPLVSALLPKRRLAIARGFLESGAGSTSMTKERTAKSYFTKWHSRETRPGVVGCVKVLRKTISGPKSHDRIGDLGAKAWSINGPSTSPQRIPVPVVYSRQPIGYAAVLRDVPARRKSLSTAERITSDPQRAQPGKVEAGRGSRVLTSHGDLREVV